MASQMRCPLVVVVVLVETASVVRMRCLVGPEVPIGLVRLRKCRQADWVAIMVVVELVATVRQALARPRAEQLGAWSRGVVPISNSVWLSLPLYVSSSPFRPSHLNLQMIPNRMNFPSLLCLYSSLISWVPHLNQSRPPWLAWPLSLAPLFGMDRRVGSRTGPSSCIPCD